MSVRTASAARRPSWDVRCLFIVLTLMAVGVWMVASSSSFFAGGKFDDQFALTRRHVVRVLMAVFVLGVTMRIDYRVWRRLAPVFLIVGVALVGGLYAFGRILRDTRRWYDLPVVHGTLQPADVARLSLVFFLAWWIARTGRDFTRLREGFAPAAAVTLLVAALIALTPNYGNATATMLVALAMMFAGGARLGHLAGLAGVCAAGLGVRLLQGGYVAERVRGWLAGGDAHEIGWQVQQSLIGLGSGGVLGVGLGDSTQKLNWLPDAYTDFIFSILGEELGLAGTLAVSTLFLLVVLRAFKLSTRCDDRFGEMLAVGIGVSYFVYAVLNMYVATGLFPVTGLPLPFVSYGGSAMLVNAFAGGVLLSVSSRRRPRAAGRSAP